MQNEESLFLDAINILVIQSDIYDSFIIEFLSKAKNLFQDIQSIFNSLNMIPDNSIKEKIVNVLFDVIKNSKIKKKFSKDNIITLLKDISDLPFSSFSFIFYRNMSEAITKLFNGTDLEDKTPSEYNSFIEMLKNNPENNSNLFVLSILSKNNKDIKKFVLELIVKKFPNISPMAILALSFALKEISPNDFELDVTKMTNTLINFLSNCYYHNNTENSNISDVSQKMVFQKQCILFLLKQLLLFYETKDGCSLFVPQIFHLIQEMSNESKTSRSLSIELIEHFPTQNAVEPLSISSQLSGFIPYFFSSPSDQEIQFEQINEETKTLIDFAIKRKNDKHFEFVVNVLPTRSDTYGFAILLLANCDILKADDNYFRECFPDKFIDGASFLMLEAIPYCIKNNIINENRIDVVIRSLTHVIVETKILSDQFQTSLKKALTSLLEYKNSAFCQQIFSSITAIIHKTISPIISIICALFAKYLEPQNNMSNCYIKIEDLDLCIWGCVLIRFLLLSTTLLDDKQVFLDFLDSISKKIYLHKDQDSVVEPAQIMSPQKLFSLFIPSRLTYEFIMNSFEFFKKTNDESFAITCVITPGLDTSRTDELINAVHSNLKADFFSIFYITYATHSSDEALSKLYLKVKNEIVGWFNHKKNASVRLFLCLTETLKLIMKYLYQKSDNSFTISNKNNNNKMILLIEMAIPQNEETLYQVKTNVNAMIQELCFHPELNPRTEFIVQLIGTPMYADLIPGLLKITTPDQQIVEDAIASWVIHIYNDMLARELNLEFINALFKFYKKEDLINIIISKIEDLISQYVKKEASFDPLNILELALCASKIAYEKDYHYTQHSTPFILLSAEYTTSNDDNIRSVASLLVFYLFIIEKNNSTSKNKANDKKNKKYSEFKTFLESENSIQKIPTIDINNNCLLLFNYVFGKIGDLKSIDVLTTILNIYDKFGAKSLKHYHIILIQSLLLIHGDLLVNQQVSLLFKLFAIKMNKLDPSVNKSLQQSILLFAESKTAALTKIFCTMNLSDLASQIVKKIIGKETLRNSFLNEYEEYISNLKIQNFSLDTFKNGVYQLLTLIISSDINEDFSGKIIVSIIIWVGLLFQLNYINTNATDSDLKNNVSFLNPKIIKLCQNEIKTLSRCFSLIVHRDTLFIISNIQNYKETLQKCSELIILSLNYDQMKNFCKSALNSVSKNECNPAISSIGILSIFLFAKFSSYSSKISKYFYIKFSEILQQCFTNGSGLPLKILCSALDDVINTEIFTKIEHRDSKTSSTNDFLLFKILDAVIKSISHQIQPGDNIIDPQEGLLSIQISNLCVWMISIGLKSTFYKEKIKKHISEAALKELIKTLYNQSSLTVDSLNVYYYKLLEYAISRNIQISDQHIITIKTLLCNSIYHQKLDIQQISLDILFKLTNTKNEKDMIKKVFTNLPVNERMMLCSDISSNFSNIKFNQNIFYIISYIAEKMQDVKEEIQPFHTLVFRKCINLILKQDENLFEIAKNTLDKLKFMR